MIGPTIHQHTPLFQQIRTRVTADQLEFLDRIIDALSETGFVDPKNFYESPYTDIDSQGIVGVFPKEQAKRIIEIVKGLNEIEAA